jgi:hypothetical protein
MSATKRFAWFVAVLATTLLGLSGTAEARDLSLPSFDRNGDGGADLGVLRFGNPDATQWVWFTSTGFVTDVWGASAAADVPVPADYDGDGIVDAAVWRPGSPASTLFVKLSAGGSLVAPWGDAALGDLPLAADVNGDRRADLLVYRPGTPSTWYVRVTGGTPFTLQWGEAAPGDVPIVADFDDDGSADIGVRRPQDAPSGPADNHFIVRLSSGGALSFLWGTVVDFFVPGDLTGEGAADATVVRRMPDGNLRWFTREADGTFAALAEWGDADHGDVPVAADYDGDGTLDIAVWRPTSPRATFWIRRTATGAVTVLEFGDGSQDIPVVYAGHCLQNAGTPGCP